MWNNDAISGPDPAGIPVLIMITDRLIGRVWPPEIRTLPRRAPPRHRLFAQCNPTMILLLLLSLAVKMLIRCMTTTKMGNVFSLSQLSSPPCIDAIYNLFKRAPKIVTKTNLLYSFCLVSKKDDEPPHGLTAC